MVSNNFQQKLNVFSVSNMIVCLNAQEKEKEKTVESNCECVGLFT